MNIEQTKVKIRCSVSGCNEQSKYTIVNKKFVFDGSVYLCENCINELYGEIGKLMVPKNVKPIYKKGGKDE